MSRKSKKYSIICQFCSKNFDITSNRLTTAKYCSVKCHIDFRIRKNKENRPEFMVMNCMVHGFLEKEFCYFETLKNKNLKPHCKKCRSISFKKWETDHPEEIKLKDKKKLNSESYQRRKGTEKYKQQRMNVHLKSKFGITLEYYEKVLLEQNNKCAICLKNETKIDKPSGVPIRLAVDHCHEREKNGTKYVRGLLCNNCNASLGFANDSVETLKRMINYINKHKI